MRVVLAGTLSRGGRSRLGWAGAMFVAGVVMMALGGRWLRSGAAPTSGERAYGPAMRGPVESGEAEPGFRRLVGVAQGEPERAGAPVYPVERLSSFWDGCGPSQVVAVQVAAGGQGRRNAQVLMVAPDECGQTR